MSGPLTIAGTLLLAWDVLLAVAPLTALFLLFQALFLELPRREVTRILTGTLMASAGLFLFLAGVALGFLPFGRAIGEAIGSLPQRWLLLPFGLVLGFVTTWGEPAVRILADQVEEASTGSIRRTVVIWTVCLGVALAVGLGMLRIAYGVPLLALLVPGYGLVIVMMRWSERRFVSIAVDVGGVATGPLANTFLLALAFGASAALGDRDPLVQGLGLVSLIALAPVLAVMTLGLLVRARSRQGE
ncbi:MAG: DUF1538 domain-containing protein [Vicinamibacterales bacterium]